MKKLVLIIFLIAHGIAAFCQQQVNFTFENAYTFNRIENAQILVKEKDSDFKIYASNEHGRVHALITKGSIDVIICAEGYLPLKTHFNINKSMDINAILLPKKYIPPKADNSLLLEGTVKDDISGKGILNAKIEFPELGFSCNSDKSGKFYLKKRNIKNYNSIKEADSLTIIIYADGFETNKIKYRFSQECEYTSVSLTPLTIPDFHISDYKENINLKIKIEGEYEKYLQDLISNSCGNLPTTIRVGTNCSCNTCSTVEVMNIETYVQTGLNDEWISSWEMESLKAGSLPYKTYGAYYVLHPYAPNYDLANTTCKQVWDNDYSASCIDAATQTQGEYLVTVDNEIAFSEYSAENNGLDAPAGEGCGDGYAGTGNSYPCISDIVCAGHSRFGHGRGMCQWGSQRWALQGRDYQWIADHYYNPAEIYRCESSNLLDCSNAIELDCGVMYHGPSSSAASNITYYGCNNWTETGPERVHKITPLADGTITATISNFTGDLDVYILGSCDPNDCLGTVNSSDAFYEEAQAGHTYFIVVDSDDGSNSSYDLIVDCPASEDLLIANEMLDDVFINSGETVHTDCDYIYSGSISSSNLPVFNLGYYLSADCIFDNNDILLGSDSANLGVESPIQHITKSLTIPSETDTGDYYILFIADLHHELSESNEDNNLSCIQVYVNQHESILRILLQELVQLYPNPAKESFRVECKGEAIKKILIRNSLGMLAKEVDPTCNMDINISNLTKGLYFVEIISVKNEKATLKLIKQ